MVFRPGTAIFNQDQIPHNSLTDCGPDHRVSSALRGRVQMVMHRVSECRSGLGHTLRNDERSLRSMYQSVICNMNVILSVKTSIGSAEELTWS